MNLGRLREVGRVRRDRGLGAGVVIVLIGSLCTAAVFLFMRRQSRESQSEQFFQSARHHVRLISRQMDFHVEQLDSVRRFYDASDFVTPEEFDWFVRPLMNRSAYEAIAWLSRDRMEEGAVAPDYIVWHDSLSNEEQRELVSKAAASCLAGIRADSDEPRNYALSGIDADDGEADDVLSLIILPVFRHGGETSVSPLGIVAGWISGKRVFEIVNRQHSQPGLHVKICGMYSWENGSSSTAKTGEDTGRAHFSGWLDQKLSLLEAVRLANDEWLLKISANREFFGPSRGRRHVFVVPAGLFLTLLMALHVRMLARLRLRAEQLAEEKTVELRKQTEERIRAEKKLLAARHARNLGMLAGGIAHDFNNLLMACTGNLELLEDATKMPLRENKHLCEVQEALFRCMKLVRQLLAYVGEAPMQFSEVDVCEWVGKNLSKWRSLMDRRTNLEVSMQAGAPTITADPEQLGWAVGELIINAAEAMMKKPGRIILNIKTADLDGRTLETSYVEHKPPPGEFLLMEIADSGHGLDKQTMENIFNPFFSTKFPGRGLSLPAVMGIVRLHGGALFVSSRLNHGSVFGVALPVGRGLKRGGSCGNFSERDASS